MLKILFLFFIQILHTAHGQDTMDGELTDQMDHSKVVAASHHSSNTTLKEEPKSAQTSENIDQIQTVAEYINSETSEKPDTQKTLKAPSSQTLPLKKGKNKATIVQTGTSSVVISSMPSSAALSLFQKDKKKLTEKEIKDLNKKLEKEKKKLEKEKKKEEEKKKKLKKKSEQKNKKTSSHNQKNQGK